MLVTTGQSVFLVEDQPVGPVTNFWEQRFESVFGFPDTY